MKHVILPVFVPHMGCPHTCVFCNQFRITGTWQPPDLATLACQAEEWAASSGTLPELAFYGGSFTAIDLKTQTALLESAAQLKKDGRISRVRLSTRPDALDAEVLARLAHYGVDTVEIGVQSLDDEVLAASQRGHTAAQAEDAIRRVQAAGFRCGAQMMVALPGEAGVIADAPGLRSLPLVGHERGLARAFPEIVEVSRACRFGDCTHTHEPGCAVREAEDAGQIDSLRLETFQNLASSMRVSAQMLDPDVHL